MAAEIMETSRLYARTCARLDPLWALELGAHLLRVAHSEPFWNAEAGRVMVKQRTRLYGLELETRAASYGKIDPAHATEIFIREGLVNDTITFPLDCITHNRKVREKLELILTRTRDSGYLNLDEALYRFYAARLLLADGAGAAAPSPPSLRGGGAASPVPAVSSVPELVDLVRERRGAEPRFLMVEPEDLRDPDTLHHDAGAFPEALPLQNSALPLNYAYKPGQVDDGVTLDVNVREAEDLTPVALDWAVPGHLEPKVEHYLRALPKELRRAFVPLTETARTLAGQVAQRDRLTGRRESLVESLAAELRERFRVAIDPALWADKPLPDHLRVRVRVLDDDGKELCASRELTEIQTALNQRQREASATVARAEPAAWRQAREQWEKPAQTAWTFGDIPAQVLVTEQAGVPVYAFPGLLPGEGGVALRLGKTAEEARAATARGLAALLEQQLRYELGWLERDLKALRELGPLISTLAPLPELQRQALGAIRQWVCAAERVGPSAGGGMMAATFAAALEKARTDLRGLVPRLMDQLRDILALRQSLLVHPQPYDGMARELAALLPPDFLQATPYAQLAHFPRYLKAMKLRADRWRQNPAKDAERARLLAPYDRAWTKLPPDENRAAVRWLIEEFRVSVFAQELGTAEPVSAVKLDRALGAKPAGAETGTGRAEPPRPIVTATVPATKATALKSLGALDRLFKK
jgi:ATP-dependent helicase HrpA